MNVISPFRLPAAMGEQARPSPPSWVISLIGAVIGTVGDGPDPAIESYRVPPTVAVAVKLRSLADAPTEMAVGALAGEPMVCGSGPELPADTTTITPMLVARWIALSSRSSR